MLSDKTIAVVVPAFNEENQIEMVIATMPEFVDRIVVVNDNSTDNTGNVVENLIDKDSGTTMKITNGWDNEKHTKYNVANQVLAKLNKDEINQFVKSEVYNRNEEEERVILINNLENRGVGAAIARGYKWCKDFGIDCTAVMAGDGQMDPDELESICRPVVEKDIDYVKGNRLIHKSSRLVIPKVRFLGNSILSILTKVASGYWHVSDTQTGYTAISKSALNAIKLHKIYKSYGMPNDILVRLNIAMCTIREVEIKPVYNVGESSKMKIFKVIPRVSWLLIKAFFRRLWVKYLFRDFHPLFLLYNFSFLLFFLNLPFFIEIARNFFRTGVVSANSTLIVFMFMFIMGFQAFLFAMWMDIQDNERLNK